MLHATKRDFEEIQTFMVTIGAVVTINIVHINRVSSSHNFVFQKDEVYLNLVLCYVPETVYRVTRHYNKSKQYIPYLYVKVKI